MKEEVGSGASWVSVGLRGRGEHSGGGGAGGSPENGSCLGGCVCLSAEVGARWEMSWEVKGWELAECPTGRLKIPG